ncbi:MAG: ComEC/Rec2 family competence protein, partial [Pseudomonadota bacterium]
MAVTDAIQAHLARQVPQVYLWCAVGFATGAGLYFGLPYEPGFWSLPVLCVLSFLLLTRRAPLLTVVACLGLGYGWAGIKAHWVAGPVLDKRMYTTVTGRVVLLDKSASDKPRMTLDQVQIEKLAGRAGPHRVRIALHGPGAPPDIGDRLRIVAHLSPPPGPAEPHGFDFQRHAWFLRLGAVGYARKPPVDVGQGGGVPMAQMRARVTDWVHTHLPQRTGGVAVAITTGDRSYLTTDVVQDLRAANLAHLLAISGLHMGLLAGLMFGVLRFAFLPLPRGDPKRWAAAGALALAFGYLLLSGASIATERAFVMTAVVFGAVILRRRALTLRAVALAVWIVLVLRPQAIISPGFHMSFAATIALIVAFRWITDHGYLSRPGPLRYLGSATVSALVAGAATAPFAAAHFNMIPHYGLVANLLAVPLMASVVMPGWIIAVILTPVGAEGLGFWIMDHGLQAILWIAHQVAGWAGAVSRVKSPAPVVLPAMTLGAIFFILWQGHIRWAGIGAVA